MYVKIHDYYKVVKQLSKKSKKTFVSHEIAKEFIIKPKSCVKLCKKKAYNGENCYCEVVELAAMHLS